MNQLIKKTNDGYIFSGIGIGIIEICIYLFISFLVRSYIKPLQDINILTYYWLTMTVLTGFWESVYIDKYNKVVNMAQEYINEKKHTWTNEYTIDYVAPWKVSEIFYTEYAAYADREYMSKKDYWSHFIEGSHELCCGLFALIALISKHYNNNNLYLISISISMGTQFMNSLLYWVNYLIQTKDKDSVNFNSKDFPLGFALSKRPFFWVNAVWLILPAYAILNLILFNL